MDVYLKKRKFFLKDKNFLFLIVIYIYLIVNSFFIAANYESIIRSLGFIRYIIDVCNFLLF